MPMTMEERLDHASAALTSYAKAKGEPPADVTGSRYALLRGTANRTSRIAQSRTTMQTIGIIPRISANRLVLSDGAKMLANVGRGPNARATSHTTIARAPIMAIDMKASGIVCLKRSGVRVPLYA
jgi:hypothetical protein